MLQGNLIRQAFETSVEILGDRATQALVEDLRRCGVLLNDPEITLSKLVHAIKEILGAEVAELVAERLIIKLDEMHSKRLT